MSSERQKTIFIAVEQGFAARYVLRTKILDTLKVHNANIVILCPNFDEDYIQREFCDANVSVEPFKSEACSRYFRTSRLQKFFRLLRSFSYNRKYPLNTADHWYQHYRQCRKNDSLIRMLYNLLTDLMILGLKQFKSLRRLLVKLESLFFVGRFHEDLLNKYKPDLLITTSMGNMGNDQYIMREARRRGIKIVCIILSWDNPTTKGMAGALADHYIVWTEIMKQELIEAHDIPADKIHVGGVALYDVYSRPEELIGREEIFAKYSLSADKKLLFLCLMSPTQFRWNVDLVKVTAKAIAEGRIKYPCQLLVRPHPIYYAADEKTTAHRLELEEMEKLSLEYSFLRFDFPEILSQHMAFDMSSDDMVKLGSILRHTDVLLCYYSSMIIEACIFNVPVISISLFEKNRIANSIIERHNHTRRLIQTQGISIAYKVDELIDQINQYLTSPSLHEEGRHKIVRNEAGAFLGNAGIRIGNQVLNCL